MYFVVNHFVFINVNRRGEVVCNATAHRNVIAFRYLSGQPDFFSVAKNSSAFRENTLKLNVNNVLCVPPTDLLCFIQITSNRVLQRLEIQEEFRWIKLDQSGL